MKIFNIEKTIRPRILLIDFSPTEAQTLRDYGYKVHLGATGLNGDLLNIPTDPHRVDIVAYRSCYNMPTVPSDAEESVRINSFCEYKKYSYKSHGLICGFPKRNSDSCCGLEGLYSLGTEVLKKNGTVLVFMGETRIEEDDLLVKKLLDIKGGKITYTQGDTDEEYDLFFRTEPKVEAVGNYIEQLMTGALGHSVDLLRGMHFNCVKDHIGEGDKFFALGENTLVHSYFCHLPNGGNVGFFPDFKAVNINIIKHILRELPALSPEALFSKDYQEGLWLDTETYKFSDEIRIINEKKEVRETFNGKIEDLESKRSSARENSKHFRALLTNGDDDKVDEEEKLKPPLKKTLEWLGFEVVDMDAMLEKEDKALINDFILKADGKEILCEAKGVTRGPCNEYVEQVKNHMLRYSKLIKNVSPPGLLILNYQRDKAPNNRGNFYSDPAALEGAREASIGLLDTRVLFDICKKVYANPSDELKKKARDQIFLSGIIGSISSE
ncbi:MAG: hypothetical protein ABIG55_02090 [Candidatus Omnitrophota bacterium]